MNQIGGQKSTEQSPGGRAHPRHHVDQAAEQPQQSHGGLWFLPRCQDTSQDSGTAERLLVALGQGNQLLLRASGCLSVFIHHPVFACQGCQNKAPQTWPFKPQKRLFPQFWRLEVESKASSGPFPPEALSRLTDGHLLPSVHPCVVIPSSYKVLLD